LPLSRHVDELKQRTSHIANTNETFHGKVTSIKSKRDNLPSKAKLKSILNQRHKSWSALASRYGVHLQRALHQGRHAQIGMVWSIWQLEFIGDYDALMSFLRQQVTSRQGQIAQSWQLAPAQTQQGLMLSLTLQQPEQRTDS
jgi:hypothetical protein